ncbi:MAG: 4Fe-4S dicluster domain-containing protein, partial [Ignavibacteriales bacterium]|nr:4Fe-4S dicluster domain-containing protein [Ignavibacteriales bacterium]
KRERGALEPLDVEDEERESFGADDVDKLPRNLILGAYACTECGRCDDACPATTTGKALSPRAIEIAVRRRSEEYGEEGALVPDYISEKEIWQCLTCGACVEECPAMIEHVDTIVETRRHLALTAGQTPPEIDRVLREIERTGNPYGMPAAERLAWADGLSITTARENADAEWLLWVGCAGAYDDRAKRSTRAFAELLVRAGADFRVLGEEERCAGDLSRRLGEEYLAKTLIEENIETFDRYGVKKIVTACPHCFHSLKREYPQFGGNYEVWHSTEFLDKLFTEGRLSTATKPSGASVAYHDSCYLGRYNGAYESPRRVIQKATGRAPKEPKRTRSRAFCCGGGGGGAFREETDGEPTIRRRVEELIATDAEQIAVACPFCLRMIEDELTRRDESPTIRALDVAEATLDAIEQSNHE